LFFTSSYLDLRPKFWLTFLICQVAISRRNFTEVLRSSILGSPNKSQQILSPLSYIAVNHLGYKSSTGRGRGHVDAGTE
jgi:hypothetical protein